MPEELTETPPEKADLPRGWPLALFSLTALGVVYGDIGTSPLYALRECFHGNHAADVSTTNVPGVLSLIFWSLTIVICVKYLIFILRADNDGEGGILALAALVTPVRAAMEGKAWLLLTIGLLGASLLYADGMITPAISVLSAVQGLSAILWGARYCMRRNGRSWHCGARSYSWGCRGIRKGPPPTTTCQPNKSLRWACRLNCNPFDALHSDRLMRSFSATADCADLASS